MKFGVNLFIWTANFGPSDFDLLPRIKQEGFDGVEVALFDPTEFPAAGIRKALEANALEGTVCSVLPAGFSVISEDGDVRRKTVGHMQACIRAVAEAGIGIWAGPLYSPVGYLSGRRRSQREWDNAVDTYHQLAPVLDQCGVTLALEPLNRFETYFLNTAADGAALCREVNHPRVGLLVDTFHSNIEEKNIPAAYRVAGPFLKHVHTSENDRGTPGSGHVDWAGVFGALRELNYDGWLTIESFGFALGALSAAASIWRDLAPSPETIAFEGLRFLKRQAG